MSEFVLGVDLDGVVANYEKKFKEITSLIKNVAVSDIPAATDWSFVKSGWPFESEEDFLATHKKAVVEYNLFNSLEPITGASDSLWELSDHGVRIRIVTYRLVVNFSHSQAVQDTISWLESPRPDGRPLIPYRDICFVKDKAHVGCDMYVDDAPHNIEVLRKAKGWDNVLVFDQEYNKHITDPRVSSWGEIVDIVKKRVN